MRLILSLMLIFMASTADAQLQRVAYRDGNQQLAGFYAKPESADPSNAGILILPAWLGIDDHSKETATLLAKKGYHAFVADIYGEGNYPKDRSQAAERSGYFKKNLKEYHNRIEQARRQLVKSGADPQKIAIIGYCFGGTGALEAARMNMPVLGVVSFHGGLARDETRPMSSIKPKILVCHGADDPFVPEGEIKSFQQEMRESRADWQMIYYADAVHSFTEKAAGNDKSKGAAYNETADRRSWEHMEIFLTELFR